MMFGTTLFTLNKVIIETLRIHLDIQYYLHVYAHTSNIFYGWNYIFDTFNT